MTEATASLESSIAAVVATAAGSEDDLQHVLTSTATFVETLTPYKNTNDGIYKENLESHMTQDTSPKHKDTTGAAAVCGKGQIMEERDNTHRNTVTESESDSDCNCTAWDIIASLYLPILLLWFRRSMFGAANLIRSVLLGQFLHLMVKHVAPSTSAKTSSFSVSAVPLSWYWVQQIASWLGTRAVASSSFSSKLDPQSCPPPAFTALALLTVVAFIIHPDGLTWFMLRTIRDLFVSLFQSSTMAIRNYGIVPTLIAALTLASFGFLLGIVIRTTIMKGRRKRRTPKGHSRMGSLQTTDARGSGKKKKKKHQNGGAHHRRHHHGRIRNQQQQSHQPQLPQASSAQEITPPKTPAIPENEPQTPHLGPTEGITISTAVAPTLLAPSPPPCLLHPHLDEAGVPPMQSCSTMDTLPSLSCHPDDQSMEDDSVSVRSFGSAPTAVTIASEFSGKSSTAAASVAATSTSGGATPTVRERSADECPVNFGAGGVGPRAKTEPQHPQAPRSYGKRKHQTSCKPRARKMTLENGDETSAALLLSNSAPPLPQGKSTRSHAKQLPTNSRAVKMMEATQEILVDGNVSCSIGPRSNSKRQQVGRRSYRAEEPHDQPRGACNIYISRKSTSQHFPNRLHQEATTARNPASCPSVSHENTSNTQDSFPFPSNRISTFSQQGYSPLPLLGDGRTNDDTPSVVSPLASTSHRFGPIGSPIRQQSVGEVQNVVSPDLGNEKNRKELAAFLEAVGVAGIAREQVLANVREVECLGRLSKEQFLLLGVGSDKANHIWSILEARNRLMATTNLKQQNPQEQQYYGVDRFEGLPPLENPAASPAVVRPPPGMAPSLLTSSACARAVSSPITDQLGFFQPSPRASPPPILALLAPKIDQYISQAFGEHQQPYLPPSSRPLGSGGRNPFPSKNFEYGDSPTSNGEPGIEEDESEIEAELQELGGQMVGSILDC